MEDGWQHGPARNDQIKAHPSLVPYDELPDCEKDYDRVMVDQVIKVAVALDYRIDAFTLRLMQQVRAALRRDIGWRA